MFWSVADLEDMVAERIEALPTTKYAQGSTRTLTWRRSPIPLTATTDRQLWDHLSFSASLESVLPHPGSEGEPGEYVPVVGELRCPFVYRIRPSETHALEDARGASEAARQVMGTLLWALPEVTVWPLVMYRPGPIESEFMAIDLRIGVLFDLSLPRPVA